MKIRGIATIMVMTGTVALAGETPNAVERRVTVCMQGDIGLDVSMEARAMVSKIFSNISVTIDWQLVLSACPKQALQLNLSAQTPPSLLDGALAYALPYEGTHVVIFYDRVRRAIEPSMVSRLLGHVIAHELGHILQGINRHSDRGLMKARWDGFDYSVMRRKPIAFTDEDVALIHRSLAAKSAQRMMAVEAQF